MREERKFTETQRNILALLKVEGAMSRSDVIAKIEGNAAYVAANIFKMLDEGFIYTVGDADLLQVKYGLTNLDANPTHEWRWDGPYIEGERLPGCLGQCRVAGRE